jgi:beta-glucosidase
MQQGPLSEAELDLAPYRLFDLRLRLGLLAPAGQRPFAEIAGMAHQHPRRAEGLRELRSP